MASTIRQRLKELGVTLPAPPSPAANYVPAVRSGNQLFIAGQTPVVDGKAQVVGKLGADVSIDGASDLFVAAFGDAGRHVRTAVGAGSLPRGAAIGVEAVFEVCDLPLPPTGARAARRLRENAEFADTFAPIHWRFRKLLQVG